MPEQGREGLAPPFEPVSVGRINTVLHLRKTLTSDTGPAVQLLRGEVGSGRTTLMNALDAELRSLGSPVLLTTCLPGHHLTPCLLGHRLLAALTDSAPDPAALPAPFPAAFPESGAAPRPAGARDAQRPRPEARTSGTEALHAALDTVLRARGPAVLLIDDAQHADPESVSVLRRLVTRHPGLRLVLSVAPVRCGWPAAQQDERTVLEALSGDLSVTAVEVPPLSPDDIARILATRLRAVPDGDLVAELHRLSGGNPAAAEAAFGQAESGLIRVLVGHAHLVTGARPPVLPNDDRFVQTLRGLGDVLWRVAKALALVEHMGPPTVELIATSTDLPVGVVREALDRLTLYGFVSGPEESAAVPGRGWAFRVPLVARAVQARLGPYERRVTSATTVRALWRLSDGMAEGRHKRDPAACRAYLADRIVDAGTMVDRERAARALFSVTARLRATHRRRASRWLRAAVERSDDPALTVRNVLDHVSEAIRAGDGDAVEETVETLVRARAQTGAPAPRVLAAVDMARLAATGELAGLASRYRYQRARADPDSAVLAVLAGSLLGLWPDVLEVIGQGRPPGHHEASERAFLTVAGETAQAMCGDPAALYRGLRERPSHSPVLSALYGPLGTTLIRCEALLALGDLHGVRAFLRERGLTAGQLPRHDVVLEQFLSGAWSEAMGTARRLMANSLPTGRVPVSGLLHVRTATVLLAQGWPSRARAVLDIARSAGTPMAHLLDAEEAAIHRFHGRTEDAWQALRRGLAEAAAGGWVWGTGPLWSALAVREAAEGRHDAALSCLARLRTVGAGAGDVGRLLYLRARIEAAALCAPLRAALADTASDGPEAVDLARSLGQPYESAVTLLLAATAVPALGSRRRELLWESYEEFGRLDALLWRHRARQAMKDVAIPVPDRGGAAHETELLMARLVAEGLSNRQMAASLGLSETSVSSRLNRVFRRTGFRSRVELATAVATGALPSHPLGRETAGGLPRPAFAEGPGRAVLSP